MNTKLIAAVTAAGALVALPATGVAETGKDNGKGQEKQAQAKTKTNKRCAKTQKVGFSVSGTLVSVTADDPATTDKNESAVTLTVTNANSHARKSGEIADQDAARKGTQVAGATYTVAGPVKLDGFEGTDTPSPGDAVKVNGKIALTKKKCAAAGTTEADRYAAPTIKKITVSDRDADA